jgi:hypothetical protein
MRPQQRMWSAAACSRGCDDLHAHIYIPPRLRKKYATILLPKLCTAQAAPVSRHTAALLQLITMATQSTHQHLHMATSSF